MRMLERLALVRGPRDEIARELDKRGEDAARLGKADKATEFARARREVEDGDGWVEVHHTAYYVVE